MYNFSEIEKKILKFWEKNKVFEKLRKKNQGKKHWSFLDGPITANNPMGVHHAWGRTYKDLFQRYKAMQGFDQRYQNGFDCQGLWVEVEVEKELGFKNKKDIEKFGIDKFVEACKQRALKYSRIQTEQSIRLGQWMDWDNSYYTMSDKNNYTIWGFLKKCQQMGLLYKGKDSVPWCPRCGTAISQHEILTEDYKEITHSSIYMEYPVVGKVNEFLLVWTTTPWTLPGNVAVAVDAKKDYAVVTGSVVGNRYYILKCLAESLGLKVESVIKGEKLVGLEYKSPFDYLPRVKKALGDYCHRIVATNSLILDIGDTEGTGLVHIAPGSGAEDFRLSKEKKIPVVELIDEEANYLDGLDEFSNKNAKKHPEIIIDYLKSKDNGKYLFDIKPITHRYPVCWRCKSELVWRVVDEWYISMDKLRKQLVEITKKIKWIPEFGLERELDWLKNMHDWLISKKRYWGLALPIYECQGCENFEVIGSKEELETRAISDWDKFEGKSPHRPWIDEVKIKCQKCGKEISRIKDVGNPWLDAGIVPFSTMDKDWFPADLVCESFPGQFKNWFYSLIVMSVVLKKVNPMETIFGYASVKDEKGEEMHKSKGNAIWFDDAVEKIGADVMRWLYAKQNPACDLKFGYGLAEETKRKLLTLYNVYSFFETYVPKGEISALAITGSGVAKKNPKNVLDKWILSRFNNLIIKTTKNLDNYNAMIATIEIEEFFIDDLSLWYVRRSRDRFRQESKDGGEAVGVFYYLLLDLLKIISPIMPFFSEEMYQRLKSSDMPESIHLLGWPKANKKLIDAELEDKMTEARKIVALALSERAEKGVKVRQPLASLKIKSPSFAESMAGKQNSKIKNNDGIIELIKEEVNVKEIIFGEKIEKEVELDFEISEELKKEGEYRELVRNINNLRKNMGLTPSDFVMIESDFEVVELKENLMKEIRAKDYIVTTEIQNGVEIFISGKKYFVKIEKT